MTNKGHAVTNPRISAGATVVRSPRLPWGSGFVPTSSHDLEGGEFCLLDFKQPYQRRGFAAAATSVHSNEAAVGNTQWFDRGQVPLPPFAVLGLQRGLNAPVLISGATDLF